MIRLCKINKYDLKNIFNMDETPMRFDNPHNGTLRKKGEHTIHICTNGAEKKGFTFVLTCAADGSKVIPHIIFKGVRNLGEACNQAGCLEYMRAVFPQSTIRKLLIWDSFAVG